jgi:signal transduction histidine kinase
LLIFEDRTEQIQLASARDTLLRVRTATFDNLFEAIGVFASDGRLHLWNNKFRSLWEFEEEHLAAHPRVDALVPHIAGKLRNPNHAGLVRELVRSATVERKQRGGRVSLLDGREFDFAAVPLPDGNALFTMLDITSSRVVEDALRERNEALEEADRLKTDFVSNMSYELRTPLTSIGGFAEMLAGGYAGELTPTAWDYVTAIMEAVARLSALIDNVLDLTQSDSGSLMLAEDQVDLIDLCQEVAADLAPFAAERDIEFVKVSTRASARSSGTAAASARRSATCSAMAFNSRKHRVVCCCMPLATEAPQRSPSPTMARASRRPSRPACSIVSTAAWLRLSAGAARSASACRSRASSSKRMAARSSFIPSRARGRR